MLEIEHKITPEFIERVAKCIRAGNFRMVAAKREGINDKTFYMWLANGKKIRDETPSRKPLPNNPYVKLHIAVEAAEAEAHEQILADVLNSEDPRVKLRFLELRYNKLSFTANNSMIRSTSNALTSICSVKPDSSSVFALGFLL